MSEKYFCPNCGAPVAPTDKFCQSCGAKLVEQSAVQQPPVKPTTPQYSGPYVPPQAVSYQGQTTPGLPYQGIPQASYAQLKPSYFSRTLAYLLDGIIFGFIGSFCFIIPLFKDVIPERGKSFGKAILNLKVVDYDTGIPITAGQACLRQLGFIITAGFDIFVPLCTEDGRRVGDYIAGTIVLEDI